MCTHACRCLQTHNGTGTSGLSCCFQHRTCWVIAVTAACTSSSGGLHTAGPGGLIPHTRGAPALALLCAAGHLTPAMSSSLEDRRGQRRACPLWRMGDLPGLRLLPGARPGLRAVRLLCSSSPHTPVLAEADGETQNPGQASNSFGAGAATPVWGPGSEDLLEQRDSQTKVQPRVGAHGPRPT